MAEVESIQGTLNSKNDLLNSVPKENKGRGGVRPGSGHPKGKLNRRTLEALKVRDAFRQRVMQHADDLFNAQFQLAVGEQVLMVKIKERDSKDKVLRTYFEQVTNTELIKQYLDYNELNQGDDPNDGEHFYFLSTKPANNMAIDSMINRAVGKVPEKLEISGGFFNQTEITLKIVGSKHDIIDIGDDGQLIGAGDTGEEGADGSDPVGETGSSDNPTESPPSS
jgi:hypothetical protein